MRELRDDSLIDMKFMMGDAGFTDRYFYKQIQKGNLPSDQVRQILTLALCRLSQVEKPRSSPS